MADNLVSDDEVFVTFCENEAFVATNAVVDLLNNDDEKLKLLADDLFGFDEDWLELPEMKINL